MNEFRETPLLAESLMRIVAWSVIALALGVALSRRVRVVRRARRELAARQTQEHITTSRERVRGSL